MYRVEDLEGGLATIFNVDDTKSRHSWRLILGKPKPKGRKNTLPKQRFRELIDHEIEMVAFEITGDHDGSVAMMYPPANNKLMAEELPILNLVVTDMGAYSSLEVTVVTTNPAYVQPGDFERQERKIVIKNFRSRACISESVIEIPMRLKPSWNYASLNLQKLARDAWGAVHIATTMVKINANIRLRKVYFSDQVYIYDQLPQEFQMQLHPTSNNVEEIIDYMWSKNPVLVPRKEVANKVYESKLVRKSKNKGQLKSTVKIKKLKSAMPENKNEQSPEGQARGLQISLPTTDKPVSEIMPAPPSNKVDGTGTNIIWEYPKKEKKVFQYDDTIESQPLSKAITQSDIAVNLEAGTELMKDWPPGPDGKIEINFCSYLQNQQNKADSGVAEWEQIENFNLKPQLLAKVLRQRRGEGSYDIYNAKMLPIEYEDEKIKENRKSVIDKGMNEKLKTSLVDSNVSTFMHPRRSMRNSLVEPGADWDYLEGLKAIAGDVERTQAETDFSLKKVKDGHTKLTAGDKNFVPGLAEKELPAERESSMWLLTWAPDGTDPTAQKSDAMLVDTKERTMLEAMFTDTASILPFPEPSKFLMHEASISQMNQFTAPSKRESAAKDLDYLTGTGVFYHLHFDTQTATIELRM